MANRTHTERDPERLSPEAKRAQDNFLSVRGRTVMALVAALIVLSGVAYLLTDHGTDTTPVERTDEQNTGVNAPLEQAPSPGTVEDERGDPALPEQQ